MALKPRSFICFSAFFADSKVPSFVIVAVFSSNILALFNGVRPLRAFACLEILFLLDLNQDESFHLNNEWSYKVEEPKRLSCL